MKIRIKNKYNSEVLFEVESGSIREAIQIAIRQNANLKNANLKNANLKNADLKNANLKNADLKNANLESADLENANLKNANLKNANLRNANLESADLENANLESANLENANLKNADLKNADLEKGKKITQVPLTGCTYSGSQYFVIVLGKWIKIGCELRTVSEWLKLDKLQAEELGLSLKYFEEYREFVKMVQKIREEQK